VHNFYNIELSANETQENQIADEIKDVNEGEGYGFGHRCDSRCPLKNEITEICT
jgi:hypothetical protein